MGKWAQPDYDQELVRKFRTIFDELKSKLGNDQNGEPYTFDKFVENFDETDHFTKRICEFLVKEARPRRGHVVRAPFDRFRRMRAANDVHAEAVRRHIQLTMSDDEDDRDRDGDEDPPLMLRNWMPPPPPAAPVEHRRREEMMRLRLAPVLIRRPPPAQRPDGDGEEVERERERERGEDAPGLQPFGYLGLPNPLQMPGRRIADRDTAGR